VFTFGGSISQPPGHTRWRRIVNKAFTQRQADAMRARIGRHTEDVLDEIEAAGCRFDLMADYAYKLPIRVICDLLGIPQEGRPEFTELAAQPTRRDMQFGFAEFGAGLQGIGRYAIGLIVRKRKNLGDDLLSTLIGLRDQDSSQLSNEELISTVILLLMAGYESTAVQFRQRLLRAVPPPRPTRHAQGVPGADRGRGGGDPALGADGHRVRCGQVRHRGHRAVRHQDPGRGDRVRLPGLGQPRRRGLRPRRREVRRHPPPARPLAFGSGPHFCLGAALARAKLQEGIQRLFVRFPQLRFDGDLDTVPLASNLFTFYPREPPVIA
jgi:cytochrome P450